HPMWDKPLEPLVLCLASQGDNVQVPRPSLSLHPSQGLSLGDNVTLRCHLPQLAARVELYKEGFSGLKKQAQMDIVQDMAEFPLVSVKGEDAVRYQCLYSVHEPPETSEKSEPVELVVTGEGTGESRWSLGASSSCTRMGTQPLSSSRTPVVGARPPSPSLG
uniref:Uncharacterized protein n=1 Tax=Phasianus colchicus TaxID=9054 RepID=A0A669QJD2_PHACC